MHANGHYQPMDLVVLRQYNVSTLDWFILSHGTLNCSNDSLIEQKMITSGVKKMRKKMIQARVVAIAAAALFSAHAAWADTLNYLGPAFGGFVTTSGVVTSPAAITSSPAAGGFLMQNTSPPSSGSFVAWCLDVQSWLTSPATYGQVTGTAFYTGAVGATKVTALERLATAILPSVNTKQESGAFQLALWEIVNESGGSYTLNSGNFKVGAASDGAKVLAQTWLTNLNNGTYSADTMTLSVWKDVNNNTQDLGVFTLAVPEPEIYAMMGIGLGLLVWAVRRKKLKEAAAT